MISRREHLENLRSYAKVSLLHRSGLGQEHDDRVLELMMACVGRILVKMSLSSREDEIGRMDDVKVRHVRDWISAAVINDAPWLKNLDDQCRPRKLLKFPTLDAIVAEVDCDMLLMAEKYGKITDLEGDVEIHTALSDGFNVVRMLTPRALDRESSVMQHCVGHGYFDRLLELDNAMLLSLRDRHGNPHATLRVEDNDILEISGKQNRSPVARYHSPISEFLRRNPELACSAGNGWEGYIVDDERNFYDVMSLPRIVRRAGDIYLHLEDNPTDKLSAPEVVDASGVLAVNLDWYDGPIRNIDCSGLTMYGNGRSLGAETLINKGSRAGQPLAYLSLSKMPDMKRLPSDLRCTGSVTLHETGLEAFPASLFGGGDTAPDSISLDSPAFRTLGGLKAVNGVLNLISCTAFELPDRFRARRVELRDSRLAVGANPEIGTCGANQGGLFATSSTVEFRGDASFEGEVRLSDGVVEFGPSFAAHSLQLSGSKVRKMPDELTCRFTLIMRGTKFANWPRKLTAEKVVMHGSEIDRIDGYARIGELSVFAGTVMEFGPEARIGRVVFRAEEGSAAVTLPFPQAVRYLSDPRRFRDLKDIVSDPEFHPTEPYDTSRTGGLPMARCPSSRAAA